MAFSSYKTFTTDHTQCGTADSSNFPITIFVTDADLKTTGNGGFVQNSSGYDIRPYFDSLAMSPMTFELVGYNPTTGQIEMHVKTTTLDHLSDTIYYLFFGDASISSDGSSSATWSNGYVGVWHFGTPTSLSVADSSPTNATGTNHSAAAGSGQIGGAGVFTGTEYIDVSNNAALDVAASAKITMDVWINPTSTADFQQIFIRNHANTNYMGWNTSSQKYNWQNSTGGDHSGSTTLTTNQWQWLACSRDTGAGANDLHLYYNSTADGISSSSGVSAANTDISSIGTDLVNGRNFHGSIDELRLSTVVRNQSWITAQYNNQKPSSTFLTWGSRVASTYRVIFIRS